VSASAEGSAEKIGAIERILLRLDDPPVRELIQFMLGYLTVPTWQRVVRSDGPGWTLIPFFLGVLLAIRLLPMVARKLIRFSSQVRNHWAKRRQLAKRFDSYQWRKLLGMGVGIGAYAWSDMSKEGLLLAAVCVFSGAVGWLVWQFKVAQPGASRSAARAE
jgi:hypothetical protein